MTSLSLAVSCKRPSATSKRKSPKMGNEFLLLITLDKAVSLMPSAVLDTVNLISIILFYVSELDYKNTKKLRQQQNNWEKIMRFQTILVISQANLQKH